MKLDNEYLEKEKVGKLLDFILLAIRSKADTSIGSFDLLIGSRNKDKSEVELKELTLDSSRSAYNPGYNRISLTIKRKGKGFFKTKYSYEIELCLRRGTYDSIDISDDSNTDKISKIYDFLIDIDYKKKKKSNDHYIDEIIDDLDKTIGLAYKRDDKIDSLLDGK
jgi:hypothetical protein